LPGGTATLMRNGKPVQMAFDTFAERLSAPGTDTREERIHNPLVRIDDNIAIIWAPFEFLLNGKVDHCGTDIVSLVKVDGQWLISALGDTSRTDCQKRCLRSASRNLQPVSPAAERADRQRPRSP